MILEYLDQIVYFFEQEIFVSHFRHGFKCIMRV